MGYNGRPTQGNRSITLVCPARASRGTWWPGYPQTFDANGRSGMGLFVKLGSFSVDARTFEQTKPNLRLIDGSALIELIDEHYHQFEPRYQMLLPLKRSYIPGPIASGSD
jgi:restriction system protein